MSLTLYYHPLSSFCWKALIALYENDTPFTPVLVDLGNAESRAAFLKVWPIGKFPVVRDEARDQVVPESSIIIEYLDQHFPGRTRFIPADADAARQMRMRDRFIDLHLHMSMQKVVGDKMRPEGSKDPHGVKQAERLIRTSLDMMEQDIAGKHWMMGDAFTMADCAAMPALFYVNKIMPFGATHPNTMAYLERLKARPSVTRVLNEAEPYMKMFPG
jgi:glutathione S-transferase